MFLHIQTYRFEFNEFYLHPIVEISVMIVKDDIIIMAVVTGGKAVWLPHRAL